MKLEVKRVNGNKSYIVDLPDSNSNILPNGIRYVLESIISHNNKNINELNITELIEVSNRLDQGIHLLSMYIKELDKKIDGKTTKVIN